MDHHACQENKKEKKDSLAVWVYQKTLDAVSFFVGKGILDHTFTEVGSPSEWGMLIPKGDKRVYIKFEGYVIPFHEFLFSLIGLRLPFN